MAGGPRGKPAHADRRTTEEKLAAIMTDPVALGSVMLDVELWKDPRKLLRAVVKHRKVAYKKCHATGGTFSIAVLACWWFARYPRCRVIITGPSWNNVENVVFPLIHHLMDRSRTRAERGELGIPYPPAFKTEVRGDGDRMILGISTDKAERFKGFDRTHLLYIIDEANGVETPIWEAIEGSQAGGHVHVVAVAQPELGSIGSKFYRAFHEDRNSWHTMTTSAFNSPNFKDGRRGNGYRDLKWLLDQDPVEGGVLDQNPVPYLVTRRWVWEKYHEWGEAHPWWHSKVMGEFPTSMDDSLISLAMVEKATDRDVAEGQRITVGMDPAGAGRDEFTLRLWYGYRLGPQWASQKPDAFGHALIWLEKYRSRIDWIGVDKGGLGSEIVKQLEDLKWPVRPMHAQDAVSEPEKYLDAQTERAFALRRGFDDGLIGLGGALDEKTASQLVTLRWTVNNKGQIAMEPNAARKRRGLPSPDRFQALLLGYPGSTRGVVDFTPGYSGESGGEGVMGSGPQMAGMRGRSW